MSFAPLLPPHFHQGSFIMVLSQRAIHPPPYLTELQETEVRLLHKEGPQGPGLRGWHGLTPTARCSKRLLQQLARSCFSEGMGCHHQQTPRRVKGLPWKEMRTQQPQSSPKGSANCLTL